TGERVPMLSQGVKIILKEWGAVPPAPATPSDQWQHRNHSFPYQDPFASSSRPRKRRDSLTPLPPHESLPAMRARHPSTWLLAALPVPALFWIVDLGVLRAGIPDPLDDNWEDNLIARNLVHGVGFRSQMLYPPLWPLHDPRTLTVPVLIH